MFTSFFSALSFLLGLIWAPATTNPANPPPKPIGTSIRINKISGGTSAIIGATPSSPFIFKVVDQNNNAVANANVTFTLQKGQGIIFKKTPTTDSNGQIEATWVAGSAPNQIIDVVATSGNAQATYRINATATSIDRPWGMSNAYAWFSNPTNFSASQISGYKITVTPLTPALGTYYSAMGWDGSYSGLQNNHLNQRNFLYSTWDIDNLGEAGKAIIIDPGVSNCSVFGGEGTGGSCSLKYQWEVGNPYQFEMHYKVGVDASGAGYTDQTLTITDIKNNKVLNMGTHRFARKIAVSGISLFVEDFLRNQSNCWLMPERTMGMSDAQALTPNGWVKIEKASISLGLTPDNTTGCRNMSGGAKTDPNGNRGWYMSSAYPSPLSNYVDTSNIYYGY